MPGNRQGETCSSQLWFAQKRALQKRATTDTVYEMLNTKSLYMLLKL